MEGPYLMQQVFHAGVLGQDTVQGTVFCMAFSTQASGVFLGELSPFSSLLLLFFTTLSSDSIN